MSAALAVLVALVVAVVMFFASAVILVGLLSWALFAIPHSPWPRLCQSEHIAAIVFTTVSALVIYIGVPGWIAWQVGLTMFAGMVS